MLQNILSVNIYTNRRNKELTQSIRPARNKLKTLNGKPDEKVNENLSVFWYLNEQQECCAKAFLGNLGLAKPRAGKVSATEDTIFEKLASVFSLARLVISGVRSCKSN